VAKPSYLAVANRSSAPLHCLGHGQGFVGDHHLQSGAGALIRRGDRGVALAERGQHFDRQPFYAPVTIGALATAPRVRL
jgi:hypothetical protein